MRWALLTLMVMLEVTLTVAQPETTTTRVGQMCQKTVSERVPKTTHKLISVLLRGTKKCGFLWMNTCTVYSMGFRNVSRLVYTVKKYQIQVCCNGTDVNGNCNTGEIPCVTPGKYGLKCDHECDCDRNNTFPEVCDKLNGHCFCRDGYEGPGCRQAVNQTADPEYEVGHNETDPFLRQSNTSDIAGGGDIPSRVIIIVFVLVVVFIIVFIVFCCYRRRRRRKPTSDGSTSGSEDFVISLHPTQESAQYVTPEEMRKRKKEQEALKSTEELTEKPYDYVEMRSVSGARPTLSGGSEKPEVTSVASSQAHKALEQEVDSGRQSIAYANMPSSAPERQDSDMSHYYLEDPDPKLSVSPTYSLMRRQESGDSAFDDDGYCTSPNHSGEDFNLHYSIPRYYKPKPMTQVVNRESNIYETPEPKEVRSDDSNKVNTISNPEYANVSQSIESLPDGVYSHLPDNTNHTEDSYDHISKNISVV